MQFPSFVTLMQVIPRGNFPLLEKETWKTVIKKVSHFGIRAGTFDCSHDNRYVVFWRLICFSKASGFCL